MLTAIWAPFVLADAQTYEYVDPAKLVSPTNVPVSPLSQPFTVRPDITVVWRI